MPQARITSTILAELRSITGPDAVTTDHEALLLYGQDETEDLVFEPEVVVKPGSTHEVSAILALATHYRIPVTPRAGGTGLSGGALPVHGGILLSMERSWRKAASPSARTAR